MSAKNPDAGWSPGEHALQGTHPAKTNHLSATHRAGGPEGFKGRAFAIDPAKVPDSTKFYDTPDIEADIQTKVDSGRYGQSQLESWRRTQQTKEGVPVKHGEPLRGEVTFDSYIPPDAIETKSLRAIKLFGRTLFWASTVKSAYDIGYSIGDSIKQGSTKPFIREAVIQAGTWGTALAGAEAFGAIGLAIGGHTVRRSVVSLAAWSAQS